MKSGTAGNTREYTVGRLSTGIREVDYVENTAAFSGGTDGETDEELLARYIYTVKEPGRATKLLIEEHLLALANASDDKIVSKAIAYSMGMGDAEIVVDGSDETGDEILIVACLEDNLSIGTIGRGILAATISSAGNVVDLEDTAGGKIWVRPTTNVVTEDSITFSYKNVQNNTVTKIVTIPAGTPRGTAIAVTMTDRAKYVSAAPAYAGSNTYDILIGRGVYPYLYLTPELCPVNIAVSISLTATPETGLVASIEASVNAYLGRFQIGETLDYSDLIKAVLFDLSTITADIDASMTVRAFSGIDRIRSLTATYGAQVISSNVGQITMENDARIIPGSIAVTII
jgi:hypothetical protein